MQNDAVWCSMLQCVAMCCSVLQEPHWPTPPLSSSQYTTVMQAQYNVRWVLNMCVYVYMCVSVCVFMCICVPACLPACLRACMCQCVCLCVYLRVYAYVLCLCDGYTVFYTCASDVFNLFVCVCVCVVTYSHTWFVSYWNVWHDSCTRVYVIDDVLSCVAFL